MPAALCVSQSSSDPLAGLEIRDHESPDVPPEPGWVRVRVRAAGLNHHDLWSLRGVGLPAERLPMVLGCDAAGVTDDGAEVVVHSVLNHPDWCDDETLDPRRTLLSEEYPGTMADHVWVPRRNLIAKPAELSFEEAACLPTAWLTAYRMLFTHARVQPGQVVLVQGAGGGVSTAATMLARAAGCTVCVAGRDAARTARSLQIGAHRVFATGERLPELVDVVIETVGEATWERSVRSLRPGGTLVVAGGTSGRTAPTDVFRTTLLQLRIVGATMGTRRELTQLLRFCVGSGIRPLIDEVLPLDRAREGFARMLAGELFGKIVFRP
jgi:NADPH:quinone reductase-like Zn-dependent oxidoreductase